MNDVDILHIKKIILNNLMSYPYINIDDTCYLCIVSWPPYQTQVNEKWVA
jgi:hypothetical protein